MQRKQSSSFVLNHPLSGCEISYGEPGDSTSHHTFDISSHPGTRPAGAVVRITREQAVGVDSSAEFCSRRRLRNLLDQELPLSARQELK